MRFLAREDEEDDATPGSLADDFEANEEARAFLAVAYARPGQYDLRASAPRLAATMWKTDRHLASHQGYPR